MQTNTLAYHPRFYGVSGIGFTRPAATRANPARSIFGTIAGWDRHHHGAAQLRVDLMDDGSAEFYVLRFDAATGAFTDEREVPIEPETFAALADALFEPPPVEGEPARELDCPECDGRQVNCTVCGGAGMLPREAVARYWSAL